MPPNTRERYAITSPTLVGRICVQHKTTKRKGYFPLSWWPSATVGATWMGYEVIKVEHPARERLKAAVNV